MCLDMSVVVLLGCNRLTRLVDLIMDVMVYSFDHGCYGVYTLTKKMHAHITLCVTLGPI